MECPFYTALSPIHGRGLFANEYFPVGTPLFKVSNREGKVTAFGQWVNHSRMPNVILHEEPDGYYAIAALPIYQGRELVADYDSTPDCLEKSESIFTRGSGKAK